MHQLEEAWGKWSPAAQLATAYVAIVMVVSLLFSASLYQLAAGQLEDSLERQHARMTQLSKSFFVPRPTREQLEQDLRTGRRSLQLQLLRFNAVILILSSGASYWLAKRTLKPIQEALEAQSRFSADASHELRTPLTAMQTEIEVALRNPKLSAHEARELLISNLEEVAKLKALSEGLLRLARNDGRNSEFESVSIQDILRVAIERVSALADAKKISIITTAKPATIFGDRETLIELIAILLDNAIKYSEPNQAITISSGTSAKLVSVTVVDQGHGILAKDLPHIFRRFYRADTSRSKGVSDGYGLGLSIAQKIVEMHNGSIHAKSTIGRGSNFTVKLPTEP